MIKSIQIHLPFSFSDVDGCTVTRYSRKRLAALVLIFIFIIERIEINLSKNVYKNISSTLFP